MTPSSDRVPLSKLTITLLVTALCSQFPSIAVPMLVSSVVMSSNSIGGHDLVGAVLYGILGLSFLIGGPILLGWYFTPDRNGMLNGFRGFLAIPGAYLIYSVVTILAQLKSDTSHILLFGIIPSLSIGAILTGSGKIRSRREWIGLGLAIILGIGLSTILMNRIEATTLPILYLWIWLSAVFVPELICFRIEWHGLLIWLLFMILSPIIVYQIIHLFPVLR